MYFVTICVQSRACLFGSILDGKLSSNDAGRMIQEVWDALPERYGVAVDEFVVMPNHIHGVIVLAPIEEADCTAKSMLSLPEIVHRFKTMTTKRYIDGVRENAWRPFFGKLWQRNYWEHVIRNEAELDHIREYIRNNPAQWHLDQLYVANS
jgi:REP element-mobilizing transposase RayT